MKSGFSIFDAHTHIGLARHSGRRLSSAELIARMDQYGVDRAVVIPFPVVDDRRQAHGEIARAVCNYPDRLAAVACLDPFMPLEKFQASLVDYLYRSGLRAWSRRLPGMLGFTLASGTIFTVTCAHTVSVAAAWFCLATFGTEMTISPSWAFCIDIGGTASGAVSASMNMLGNIGAFASANAFPFLQHLTGSSNAYFQTAALLNAGAILCWLRMRSQSEARDSVPPEIYPEL